MQNIVKGLKLWNFADFFKVYFGFDAKLFCESVKNTRTTAVLDFRPFFWYIYV